MYFTIDTAPHRILRTISKEESSYGPQEMATQVHRVHMSLIQHSICNRLQVERTEYTWYLKLWGSIRKYSSMNLDRSDVLLRCSVMRTKVTG